MEKDKKEKEEIIKEEKGKKKTWVVFLVIGIVLFYILFYGLIFLGFAFDIGSSLTYEDNYIIVDKDTLKIDNVMTASIIDDSYVIEGYLTNMSCDMDNVDVVFNVYDVNGILLGQAYDSVSNLKENTTWRFKATYDGFDYSDISSYELVEVNYF